MEHVEEQFRRYRNDVYRLAVSYTHSLTDAEDVCQTVFLKMIEARHIEPGKEKSWLMQVTANECKSLLRSGWWKRTAPLEETLPAAPKEFDSTLQCLLQLDPKYRVVLYLHYYERFTAKEIAGLLKISTSAVTTRLSRGREQLKVLLKEE